MQFAIVVSLMVFAAVTLLAGAAAMVYSGRIHTVGERLDRYLATKPNGVSALSGAQEVTRPAIERLAGPAAAKLIVWSSGRANRRTKETLRKRLEQAGYVANGKVQVADFLAIRVLLVVVLPLVLLVGIGGRSLVLWIAGISSGGAGTLTSSLSAAMLAAAFTAILGYLGPELFLRNAIRQRQHQICRSLPDALDLLTVCVEAGLGFDAALTKVVSESKGPLSEEFERVLHEMRLGKLRRDALRDLADRVDVEEVSLFAAALVQADQLGVSIGKVLRLQSEQARMKRRQKAEQQAMKAPIKMLFPLVFFIFPSLFVILLGPAMLRILGALAGFR